MKTSIDVILKTLLGACFLLGFNSSLFAQDCLLYESFNDNLIDIKWNASATHPVDFQCAEQNGRLEFPSLSENSGKEFFAGVISNGWKINMLEDWRVSIDYNLDFNSPTYGDTGIGFIVAFDYDISFPTLFTGLSLSGGTSNFGFGDSEYEVVRFWQDGDSTIQISGDRPYVQSTVYVWYDAELDCISYTSPGFSPLTVCGVRALSSQTSAYLGLAGYSFGLVPQSPGNQAWVDDFCLVYGDLVGPLVG